MVYCEFKHQLITFKRGVKSPKLDGLENCAFPFTEEYPIIVVTKPYKYIIMLSLFYQIWTFYPMPHGLAKKISSHCIQLGPKRQLYQSRVIRTRVYYSAPFLLLLFLSFPFDYYYVLFCTFKLSSNTSLLYQH